MSEKTKNFILCLGASRSGTTWLYHYLKSINGCDLGIRKEYNALSKIYNLEILDVPLIKPKVNSALAQRITLNHKQLETMSNSLEQYARYFENLLRKDIWLTGDISPGYLSINTEQLNEVFQEFSKKGVLLKVCVFFRDPIDRLISFLNFTKKKRQAPINTVISINDTFIERASKFEAVYRTDYASTILNVINAIPGNDAFLYPYESLFSDPGIEALSQWLGVEPRYEMIHEQINKRRANMFEDIEAKDIDKLRALYEGQYTFCRDFFRQQKIELKWKHL